MRRFVGGVIFVAALAGPIGVAATPARAMSIDCIARANGGYICEVIHDDGSKEYFEVP